MSKRRGLLLSVKDLRFTHKHFSDKDRTYLLRAVLILPRTNIDAKEAVRILEASPDGVLLSADSPFHQSTFFKQKVEGPFSVGLQLSDPVSNSHFAGIITELASASVEIAGSLLAAQMIQPLRAGIRSTASFFAGKTTDKSPLLLSDAYFDVTRSTTHSVTVELPASRRITTSRPCSTRRLAFSITISAT